MPKKESILSSSSIESITDPRFQGLQLRLLAPLSFYINNLIKIKNTAPGIPKIPINIDV